MQSKTLQKELEHQLLLVGACAPFPALLLSGLSSPSQLQIDLFQRFISSCFSSK